jgi:hypothetical protein
MSVVLTIRDVPDKVRDALAREARARGQSVQAFLLGVLERQAQFSGNRELLEEVERELSRTGGADASAPDAADVLERARGERKGAKGSPRRRSGGAA